MKVTDKTIEQEQLYFDSLGEKEKRDYFTVFFISELVFALTKKRKEAKITQSDLAKIMGVKQAYVSKIENLEKIPTIGTIARYIYALNFSISEAEQLATLFAENYSQLSDVNFSRILYYRQTEKDNTDNYSESYVFFNPSNGRIALSRQ